MLAIDWIYNVSTTNTLSTLIRRTILHYLSSFQWSVNFMNLGLDREITAVDRSSRSVDGDPRRGPLFSSEETDSC